MEQVRSTAAQIIIAVIPIVGIIMGSVVVFFYLLWNHRRKVLLIKAGQYSRPDFDLLSFSLLAGLLLVCVGITISAFLAAFRGPGLELLGGIIPLALGTALLLFYRMRHGDRVS
jgi:putative Mn2+ efflux pump MntP